MVSKRGQITIFIIVGILILLMASVYLLVQYDVFKKEVELTQTQVISATSLGGNIQTYIESCIKSTGEDAIVYIGKQGGYYQLPVIFDIDLKLPYYFYQNKSKFISQTELEKQLSLYVDNELLFCLMNFQAYKQQGYQIESGSIQTTTQINLGNVHYKINFPIYLTKGSSKKQLTNFEVKVPSRLKTIHEMINTFMLDQIKFPESVCLSCLNKLALSNDLRVELGPVDNLTLFTITDQKVKIKKKDYIFEFVNYYG